MGNALVLLQCKDPYIIITENLRSHLNRWIGAIGLNFSENTIHVKKHTRWSGNHINIIYIYFFLRNATVKLLWHYWISKNQNLTYDILSGNSLPQLNVMLMYLLNLCFQSESYKMSYTICTWFRPSLSHHYFIMSSCGIYMVQLPISLRVASLRPQQM